MRWGQLSAVNISMGSFKLYGCLNPQHICISFCRSRGFYPFIFSDHFQCIASVSLYLSTRLEAATSDWNVTDELILMAVSNSSWNHETFFICEQKCHERIHISTDIY